MCILVIVPFLSKVRMSSPTIPKVDSFTFFNPFSFKDGKTVLLVLFSTGVSPGFNWLEMLFRDMLLVLCTKLEVCGQ